MQNSTKHHRNKAVHANLFIPAILSIFFLLVAPFMNITPALVAQAAPAELPPEPRYGNNNLTDFEDWWEENNWTLVSPANGAINVDTRPEFSWGALGILNMYRLVVATSEGTYLYPLTPRVIDKQLIVGHSWTVPANLELEYGTTYYWQVTDMYLLPGVMSLKSDIWSFTTIDPNNDAPTDISLSATSIAENKPSGTWIAFINTTDPNAGDTFTYSLVSGTDNPDNASFKIVDGNHLRSLVVFDYEAKSSYYIRVRSTDHAGAYDEKTLAVFVTNVVEDTITTVSADPNPAVYGQNYTVSVVVTPASGAGTPTGWVDVSEGTNTCRVVLVSGSGSCIMPSTSAGTQTVTASYSGDSTWNASSGSTTVVINPDITAPTVTVNQASDQADPTNASPITFDVVFSEPVTGFAADDISLTGSTAPGTLVAVSGAGASYTISISGMTDSGLVTVSIPAAAAQDASGNNSEASTSTDNSVTYDVTSPTVTINQASVQVDPTNASPITFDVVFSEPVTGFDTNDVFFTGSTAPGTLVAAVSGSGASYTVSVSGMTGNGLVIPFIGVARTMDAAGNTSEASTSTDNSVTYDVTSPTVTINQASVQVDPTNTSPIEFTVTFSKSVTGFTADDVVLTSSTAPGTLVAAISGSGSNYTVSVSGMTDSGLVIVSIPSGAVSDTSGNVSESSTSADNSVTYDVISPTVTINQASGQADPSNASPITFDVTFSESVTGFTADDIILTGSTAPGTLVAAVSGAGASYTVSVSGMSDSGLVTVSISAVAARDTSGNDNEASTSADNSVTYDVTSPTVTINQAGAQADPTNASPIEFTVEFSESVTGFAADDVVLADSTAPGTLVAAVSGSGASYTVSVNGMTTNGIVTASIRMNAAVDDSGNTSMASTSADNDVLYDVTAIALMQTGFKGFPGNTKMQDLGVYTTRFGKLMVTFDSDAYNPAGDSETDDVTNPANYLLVAPGVNKNFEIDSCTAVQPTINPAPPVSDDIIIPVGPVVYSNNSAAGPFEATLTVNNGTPLPYGKYRLIVCGSTSITDLAGNPLNGGTDSYITFTLRQTPDEIPATGFPVGEVTALPIQPVEKAYTDTGMTLKVPTLGLTMDIIGVPLTDSGWDTSWLRNEAGYLEGSAFPTWAGNTVLTGHVWDANNLPGPFNHLKNLKYGDLIEIEAWGLVYTYEVRSNSLISASNVNTVMRAEVLDWLTLVTCESYNAQNKDYPYRRMVRAVLISVK